MSKNIIMNEVDDIRFVLDAFGSELSECVDLLGFDWYLMTELVGFEGKTADSVKAYIYETHRIICMEIKCLLYDLAKQADLLQKDFFTGVDAGPSVFIREECLSTIQDICLAQRDAVSVAAETLSSILGSISDIFSGVAPSEIDLYEAFNSGKATADTLCNDIYSFDSSNGDCFNLLQERTRTLEGLIESVKSSISGKGKNVFFSWNADIDLCNSVIENSAKNVAFDINGIPYTEGMPQEPFVVFDEDFPYDPNYEISASDYASYLKWQVLLEGAETLRHLPDGTAAYRHYLFGQGADFTVDYEKAYRQDKHIQRNVDDKLNEAIIAATTYYNTTGNTRYSLSGGPTGIGNGSTENWQKAIGGHQVWNSMNVSVEGDIMTIEVTVHVLDRYNFNNNMSDIATGVSDNVNGLFQVAGLANSYTTRGSLSRVITIDLSQPLEHIPTINDVGVGVSEGPRARAGEGENR